MSSLRQWMRRTVLVVTCGVSLCAVQTWADPEQVSSDAARSMARAQFFLDQGDTESALGWVNDAQYLYHVLQREYPDWNADQVSQSMQQCQQQLARIEGGSPSGALTDELDSMLGHMADEADEADTLLDDDAFLDFDDFDDEGAELVSLLDEPSAAVDEVSPRFVTKTEVMPVSTDDEENLLVDSFLDDAFFSQEEETGAPAVVIETTEREADTGYDAQVVVLEQKNAVLMEDVARLTAEVAALTEKERTLSALKKQMAVMDRDGKQMYARVATLEKQLEESGDNRDQLKLMERKLKTAQQLADRAAAREKELQDRIAFLEAGQSLDWNAPVALGVSGGSGASDGALQRELDRKNREIVSLNDRLEALNKEMMELKRSSRAGVNAESVNDQRLAMQEAELEKMKAMNARLARSLKATRAQLDSLQRAGGQTAAVVSQDLERSRAERSEWMSDADSLKAELRDIQANNEQLTAVNDQLQRKLADLKNEYLELANASVRASEETVGLRQALEQSEQALTEINRRHAQAKADEIQSLEQQVQELTAQLRGMEKEKQNVLGQMEEYRRTASELRAAKDDMALNEVERAEWDHTRSQMLAQIESMAAQKSQLEVSIQRLQTDNASMKTQVAQLNEQIDGLKAQAGQAAREGLQSLQQTRQELAQIQGDNADLREQLLIAEERAADADSLARQLQEKDVEINQAMIRSSSEMTEIRQQLIKEKARADAQEARLKEVKQELAVKAASLPEAYKKLAKEQDEARLRAEEALNKERQSQQQKMDSMQQLMAQEKKHSEELKDRIFLLEEQNAEIRSRSLEFEKRFKESEKENDLLLAEIERVDEVWKNKLAEAVQSGAAVREDAADVSKRLQSIRDERDALNMQLETSLATIESLRVEIKETAARLQAVQKQLSDHDKGYEAKMAQMTGQMERLTQQMVANEQAAAVGRANESQLAAELAERRAALDELSKAHDINVQLIQQLRNDLTQAKTTGSDVSALKAQVSMLKSKLEDERAEKAERSDALDKLSAMHNTDEQLIETLRKELSDAKAAGSDVDALQEQVEVLTMNCEELTNRTTLLERQKSALEEEMKMASDKLQKAQSMTDEERATWQARVDGLTALVAELQLASDEKGAALKQSADVQQQMQFERDALQARVTSLEEDLDKATEALERLANF